MYTTDTPKISVHEFVHEFVAFSWHCVVFYNIAQIANSFVFNGAWYCVALCGLVGFRASLSAISLDFQVITKFAPNFTPKNVKLGVFLFEYYNSHVQV